MNNSNISNPTLAVNDCKVEILNITYNEYKHICPTNGVHTAPIAFDDACVGDDSGRKVSFSFKGVKILRAMQLGLNFFDIKINKCADDYRDTRGWSRLESFHIQNPNDDEKNQIVTIKMQMVDLKCGDIIVGR